MLYKYSFKMYVNITISLSLQLLLCLFNDYSIKNKSLNYFLIFVSSLIDLFIFNVIYFVFVSVTDFLLYFSQFWQKDIGNRKQVYCTWSKKAWLFAGLLLHENHGVAFTDCCRSI